MGKICLHKLDFYSYHGCFEEEKTIGTHFKVDVELVLPLPEACFDDLLEHTLDYQQVYAIIAQEMKIPSNLLEHVCVRILERFDAEFPELTDAEVTITKLNPPIGGKMESVGFCANLVEVKKKKSSRSAD